MRYGELTKKYYHGSFNKLPIGTILKPRGQDYENDRSDASFYAAALEYYRPKNMLSHKDSVFMVAEEDDLI